MSFRAGADRVVLRLARSGDGQSLYDVTARSIEGLEKDIPALIGLRIGWAKELSHITRKKLRRTAR